MNEIKTPLDIVGEDCMGDPIYQIEGRHTVSDVIRWCLDQGGDNRSGWKLNLIEMILSN